MPVPTRQEILNKFAAVVSRSLRVDAARVTEDAYLDDLGAESLDLIEISMGIEEAFDIWLPEKSILQTARELYAPGTLEKDGLLTDAGKALLKARMPELDPASLEGDIHLTAINRQFMRVSGWITLIENQVHTETKACPKCGSPDLSKALANKRKCAACGEQVALVSGEELNRKWVRDYQASTAAK